jgi:hypothetical protein
MPAAWRRNLPAIMCGLLHTTLTATTRGDAAAATTHISSIRELFSLQNVSSLTVVMAPGTYRIDSNSSHDFGGWPHLRCPAMPEHRCEVACLFNFSGSDMIWELSGVVIEMDASVFSEWEGPHGWGPHNVGSVFGGRRNTWRGLTWRDVPPSDGSLNYPGFFPGSGAFFTLTGRGHILERMTISLRGSGLYGYGALYGKGGTHTAGVDISKRSLLSINSCADTVVRSCVFENAAFGHIIHLHDAPPNTTQIHTENVTVRDTIIRGQTRTTDDLLANPVGGSDKYGIPWRISYNGTLFAGGPPGAVRGGHSAAAFAPIWREKLDGHVAGGRCPGPLAKGVAYALTECGLRFYSNVGFARILNVSNEATRCGACFGAGIGGVAVDGLRLKGIAPHGYGACNLGATREKSPELGENIQPPSHSRVTRSSADATYVPLLIINNAPPPTDVVADVELLPPVSQDSSYGRTSDQLAVITGSDHVVRLWGGARAGASALAAGQRVYVGQTMNSSHCWNQNKKHTGCFVMTTNVSLCNLLPVPVLLSPLVTGSRVWSAGVVVDAGTGNRIVRLNSTTQKQLPPECQPILQDCGV